MRSRRGGSRSVAPPCPARHARPSLRLGWAAAPASRPGAFPRRLPLGSGWSPLRLRARVPVAGCARPCARSAASPSASPLPSLRAGLRGAVGRPRAPSPWARARFGRGRRFPLAPPPFGGFVRSRSPGGAPGRGCAAPFCALVRPPGVWFGGAAAAAAARLRRSVSPPGKVSAFYRRARRAPKGAPRRCFEGKPICLRYAAPLYSLRKINFRGS